MSCGLRGDGLRRGSQGRMGDAGFPLSHSSDSTPYLSARTGHLLQADPR